MSTENETPASSVPPPPSSPSSSASPISASLYDTASAGAYGPSPADVEKNKIFAIISYLGILFIVPLLAAKDSPFAMYHANQGLLLFLLSIALGAITMIPILGWIIAIVAWIVPLVFMIMGIINAANGQMKPLPLIGEITLLK